uniref:Uncharacterized mitochondrial protein AtMg00810-like n=1 Tax=Tanacetum cinerariifolium TaxID=118510 RepID=A0A6L2KZN1_TANCI|nr:uncharacterized mitochondrial protein AtMg00810-like [Tanacetum cinerariifolium]
MVPPNNLGPDLAGKPINETLYRRMIGSLMYLTATRPNIQFFTVLCVRYQSNPKESHLTAVKRILRYLKGTLTLGLYYPGFVLKGYLDSDYAGYNMDRKSTSGVVQTNNVVGNFNYPPNVPAYKPIMKFLQNCPLYNAFTNCLSVVYQNFLRELWSTVVAFDPFPSTDEPEKRPLKEFLIKFSVLNGQRTLTLDFNTFCSLNGLNYNNDKYVDHPTPKVLDGNYSYTKQVNSIQQLLANSLITWTEVDIGEIIYSDLVTKLLNNSRLKYVSYPRFISCALQVLLGSEYTHDKKFRFLPPILSNSNFTKDPSKVTDIELTARMIAINNKRVSVSPPHLATKPKKGSLGLDIIFMTPDEGTAKTTSCPEGSLGDKDSRGNIPPADMEPIHTPVVDPLGTGAKYQDDVEVKTPSPNQTQPEPSYVQESASDSSNPDLKRFDNTLPLTERQLIKYLRNMSRVLFNRITEKQWEHHEEASVSYTDLKASIKEYYEENIAHQDQTGQLVASSINSLDKSRSSIIDLYKGLNVITELLKDINNAVKDDPATNKKINEAIKTFAYALKQEEASAAWTKSSTNMAWNLGARMIVVEISQTALKCKVSSLKQDTSEIESMMANIYQAFKGQPSSASSSSVTLTLALTYILANVKGENATNTDTKEPPSHTEGESRDTTMDKEEKIKKADKETKLLAMSRLEVIKVVHKEAKKLGIDPKEAISTKAGIHVDMANRIKPEAIIDVRIHPNTKPIVASVFRNNDKRNFDIHNPFKFTDFGITELDKFGPIIQNKKNFVAKYLMISLSKRYERLKKILEELGIQSALPALVPKQVSSQTSRRKRKHMELEPEIKVHGLECNRSLPEGVPFVNSIVIEEPEYGIFFTDVFGDQSF